MKLIVGLGNPGNEYSNTRHNTGFLALDLVAKQLSVDINRKDFDALIGKVNYHGEQVILMKPQTYMNLSGNAVAKAVHYFHLDPAQDLLVLYDDLDLKYGQIRLRSKGSAGGHNGMKSIIQQLNTTEFKRIRIGIERSNQIAVVDYVLGKVEKEKQADWNQAIEKAAKAAIAAIDTPFDKVMNQYNKGEK